VKRAWYRRDKYWQRKARRKSSSVTPHGNFGTKAALSSGVVRAIRPKLIRSGNNTVAGARLRTRGRRGDRGRQNDTPIFGSDSLPCHAIPLARGTGGDDGRDDVDGMRGVGRLESTMFYIGFVTSISGCSSRCRMSLTVSEVSMLRFSASRIICGFLNR